MIVHGNSSNNVLVGTAYADTILGYEGADVLIGAGGTIASSVTYTLGANVENLILTGSNQIYGYGNELNNELTGNSANNVLFGGGGADTMRGGAGHDQYHVDQAGDVVIELASATPATTH